VSLPSFCTSFSSCLWQRITILRSSVKFLSLHSFFELDVQIQFFSNTTQSSHHRLYDMYTKFFSGAIAAALFASANAHFLINSPPPVPGSAIKDPLTADGSNFPCHGADLSTGTVTNLAVGADTPLGFELAGGANTAVHGGGSCQLSLTYETDATKLKDPASWKVIQSFVGGCPTNAMGNLDTAVMCPESAPNCVNSFSFKIPAEAQNGAAVLAWTWFNNVGNREMYMNCAKVSISGGSNKLDSLPTMMVANLAGINTCATIEDFNMDFPYPGNYVQKAATLNYPLKAPSGTGCGAAAGNASPASGTTAVASAPAASSAAPVASSPKASAPAASAPAASAPAASAPAASAPAVSPGIFAPGASGSAGVTSTHIATTFVTSAAPAASAPAANPPASAASAPAANPAASGACTDGQVACTASGFYCISDTTFGMCAFGCATPMDVSAGTSCSNGAVSYAANYPGKRRSARHAHKRRFAASF
jgi:hypothetical protein